MPWAGRGSILLPELSSIATKINLSKILVTQKLNLYA